MFPENCTKNIYVDVYAVGHLIELPKVTVYLAKYGGKFVVINSLTLYPLAYGDNEVQALSAAKARKIRDAKQIVISEIFRIGGDLWNWGDVFMFWRGNDVFEITEEPKSLDYSPFTRVSNLVFQNEYCIQYFNNCERFPIYNNVEFCSRGNFGYFVLTKGSKSYIFQSPLLILKYGDEL